MYPRAWEIKKLLNILSLYENMKKIIFIILIIVIFSPAVVLAEEWNCQNNLGNKLLPGAYSTLEECQYDCRYSCQETATWTYYCTRYDDELLPEAYSNIAACENDCTYSCRKTETNDDTDQSDMTSKLINPLTGEHDIPNTNLLIGQLINGILGVVGSLTLIMFIYGGFVWMTATGNSERITKGKDILIWATLGLVMIFISYALVKFILVNVIQGKPMEDTINTTENVTEDTGYDEVYGCDPGFVEYIDPASGFIYCEPE